MSGRTEDTEATAKRSRVDDGAATTGETAENEAKVFISFLNRMVKYACDHGGPVVNPRIEKQDFSIAVFEKNPSRPNFIDGNEFCVFELEYKKGEWHIAIESRFTHFRSFNNYHNMLTDRRCDECTIMWSGVTMKVSRDSWGMFFEISSTKLGRDVLKAELQEITKHAFNVVQIPDSF